MINLIKLNHSFLFVFAMTASMLLANIFKMAAQSYHIPIQLANKLILLEGTANGKEGFFILDSGAARFTLNSSHFQKQSHFEDIYRADVQIGTLKWDFKAALLMDLSYLERSKGKNILGLINSKMLNGHPIILDVSNRELQILPLSGPEWRDISWVAPDVVLPFKKKGGMPSLEVTIGNRSFRFGIDTGAECNLVATEHQNELRHYIYDLGEMIYRRSDRKIVRTIGGSLEGMYLGLHSCEPMRSLFGSVKRINEEFPGARLDGLLGFEFLSQFKIVIDFKAKKIALWSNQSDHPQIVTAVSQDSAKF